MEIRTHRVCRTILTQPPTGDHSPRGGKIRCRPCTTIGDPVFFAQSTTEAVSSDLDTVPQCIPRTLASHAINSTHQRQDRPTHMTTTNTYIYPPARSRRRRYRVRVCVLFVFVPYLAYSPSLPSTFSINEAKQIAQLSNQGVSFPYRPPPPHSCAIDLCIPRVETFAPQLEQTD